MLLTVGLYLMGFSAPISLTLFSLGIVLVITGWLLRGNWWESWRTATAYPVTTPLLIFIGYALVTTTYSDGDWAHTGRVLGVYLKLLYIPLVLSCYGYVTTGQRLIDVFYAGCVCLLAMVWIDLLVDLPWSRERGTGFGANHTIFMTHISQGMALNACAVLAWIKGCTSPRGYTRYVHQALALAALAAVFALNGSRIGYITGLGVSLILIIGWWQSRKGQAMALILVAVIVVSFLISPLLDARVTQAVNEFWAFRSPESAVTSTGTRLGMFAFSLDLISQAPIFGHGLGDYRTLALSFFEEGTARSTSAIAPTNQLLFIAVEMGLLGGFLFAWVLFLLVRDALRSSSVQRLAWVGLFWVFFVDAMGHHPIWDAGERQITLLLLILVVLSPDLSRFGRVLVERT